MSEDSDYTSDINFPTHHQNNISAHQFPREQFRQHGRQTDLVDAGGPPAGTEEDEYYPAHEYYSSRHSSSRGVDRIPSFEDERMYSGGVDYDRGYERLPYYPGGRGVGGPSAEMEFYMYGGGGLDGPRGGDRGVHEIMRASPYHPVRSDTDSEPLYYNSRPLNSRPHSFANERWVMAFFLF